MLNWCVLVGLVAEPMMFIILHVTCSCVHTFKFFIFLYWFVWCFFACFFLSLLLSLVALWHLNRNLLPPGTLFILGRLLLIPPPPMLGSVMIMPIRTFWRTFPNEAFIRNAKSSYQTFPILTFPLPTTVGVRSHCVASRWRAPPRSCKSFSSICMNLNILYLILSLAFEVRVS